MFQAGDAVQHHPVGASVLAKGVEAVVEAQRTAQLAVLVDGDIAVAQFIEIMHLGGLKEIAVLVAKVAGFLGHRDLHRQACSQGVGAGDDDAVLDAELQEGVAHRVQLGDEVLVGHGHLAGLVATLLGIGDLVFDLDGAGARFDHALGQQVGGLLVAEAGVDVGDHGHHVGLVAVDARERLRHVAALDAGLVERREQMPQLPGVGLAQEGVDFLDQVRHRGLLVHALVGQRAEAGTQRRHHPAAQVDVGLVRGLAVLLDRHHHLLGGEAVPAAEGLGVLAGVVVVVGHVPPHDVGGVAGDVEAGAEAVLQPHADHVLRVDGPPARLVHQFLFDVFDLLQIVGQIRGHVCS